jgi:hypothetical protein
MKQRSEGERVVKRDADNPHDGHSGSVGVRHLPSMVTQYSRQVIPIVDANMRAVKTTCLGWYLMQQHLLPHSLLDSIGKITINPFNSRPSVNHGIMH